MNGKLLPGPLLGREEVSHLPGSKTLASPSEHLPSAAVPLPGKTRLCQHCRCLFLQAKSIIASSGVKSKSPRLGHPARVEKPLA